MIFGETDIIGEPDVICPYCSEHMLKGWLTFTRSVIWTQNEEKKTGWKFKDEIALPRDDFGLFLGGTFTYRCENRKKMIIDY